MLGTIYENISFQICSAETSFRDKTVLPVQSSPAITIGSICTQQCRTPTRFFDLEVFKRIVALEFFTLGMVLEYPVRSLY